MFGWLKRRREERERRDATRLVTYGRPYGIRDAGGSPSSAPLDHLSPLHPLSPIYGGHSAPDTSVSHSHDGGSCSSDSGSSSSSDGGSSGGGCD